MTLPVVAYGNSLLRKKSAEIGPDYPDLAKLIDDMFETMHESSGVGLAAPQINRSIRLFIADASPFAEDYPEALGFRQVFINPVILEESGNEWIFNEGCLSVPEIHEDVSRKADVRIRYYDRDFVLHEESFSGINARIIQHEYDHLEGILFVDRIPGIRRMLLKKRLEDITKGKIDVTYKMIFPSKK